jgi:hypothetical protein
MGWRAPSRRRGSALGAAPQDHTGQPVWNMTRSDWEGRPPHGRLCPSAMPNTGRGRWAWLLRDVDGPPVSMAVAPGLTLRRPGRRHLRRSRAGLAAPPRRRPGGLQGQHSADPGGTGPCHPAIPHPPTAPLLRTGTVHLALGEPEGAAGLPEAGGGARPGGRKKGGTRGTGDAPGPGRPAAPLPHGPSAGHGPGGAPAARGPCPHPAQR